MYLQNGPQLRMSKLKYENKMKIQLINIERDLVPD